MRADGSDKIASYLNIISQYQHAFTVEELMDFADSGIDHETLQNALKSDPRFVSLGNNSTDHAHFATKKALFSWFSKLSVRLANAQLNRLTEHRLAGPMSFLCVGGRWDMPPVEAIQFGQYFGFIGPAWTSGQYVFPMAHVLSFMSESTRKGTCAVLSNLYETQSLGTSFDDLLLQSVNRGFSKFNKRISDVVQAREGLSQSRKMTLEQIGVSLKLTRERVRQLESKFWNKVEGYRRQQPFVAALLCDVMRNHGSLVIKTDSADAPLRRFISKCVGIPQAEFPRTNVAILGASPSDVPALESTGWFPDQVDVATVATTLESNGHLCLIDNDLRVLAENIVQFRRKQLTRGQKAYLALQVIGKPAHSDKITEVYNSLFPNTPSTEHNLHAVLNREEYGIIWIGVRSTFALKEWGYEHPSQSLFDTVTDIVKKRFNETNQPVSFSVIIAEIGKYRRIVRPASLAIATYCNHSLQCVSKDSFVLKSPTEEIEEEISADELDKILEEFELGTEFDKKDVAKHESQEHAVEYTEESHEPTDLIRATAITDTQEGETAVTVAEGEKGYEEKQISQTPMPSDGVVQEPGRTEPKLDSSITRVAESPIYNYPPEFFFHLAHWAKEKDELNPWERRLTFDIGRYRAQGWLLSEKQERHGLRIIQKAQGLGFSVAKD